MRASVYCFECFLSTFNHYTNSVQTYEAFHIDFIGRREAAGDADGGAWCWRPAVLQIFSPYFCDLQIKGCCWRNDAAEYVMYVNVVNSHIVHGI